MTVTTATLPELTHEERRQIDESYAALLQACSAFCDSAKLAQVQSAFDLSREAHRHMRRKSGEPYILHPIAVAHIVACEIGLRDATAVIAALLHDVVEDSEFTLTQIRNAFGASVAAIVDGLTKISKVVEPNQTTQSETLRKILVTMIEDIRVALIKIADRLHNMRTLDSMREDQRAKICAETQTIYAPLAQRLGLYRVRSELEDLALRFTNPTVYNEITAALQAGADERGQYIEKFIEPIRRALADRKVACQIYGRVKGIAAIYSKMKRQSVSFKDVYDVFAVRIVIDPVFIGLKDEIEEEHDVCWLVYSAVTHLYRPSIRMRNWLETPRANQYEALHVTVLGPDERWVEVQIRTRRMDQVAESGLAAHWRYKEGQAGGETLGDAYEDFVVKIREFLDNQRQDPQAFLDDVRFNVFGDQIHIFTPKGDVRTLPKGATVLDFAYNLKREIGDRCIGAKVNQRVEPISYKLKNGDQVEALTSEGQYPDETWLQWTQTPAARKRVEEALTAKRARILEDGKRIFDKGLHSVLKKLNKPALNLDHPVIDRLLDEFDLKDIDELYYRLGSGKINFHKLKTFIKSHTDDLDEFERRQHELSRNIETLIARRRQLTQDGLVIGDELQDQFRVKYARCCNPTPPEPIIAFASKTRGLVVHRADCEEMQRLLASDAGKCINVIWQTAAEAGARQDVIFLAGLRIQGNDRKGMLVDLVSAISNDLDLNIHSFGIESYNDMFQGDVMFYVRSLNELDAAQRRLLTVPSVYAVRRLDDRGEGAPKPHG